MTQQTFCHRKILFAAVSLQQHFWPECLINFCHYTTFTVKRNSPSVLVRATAEGRNIDLNVLWSLVHEKTEVLPHIDKRILTHCCSQCCKLTHTHTYTHTLILSKLSYDKGIVHFLWLPQMGLPDLRDDVIGFFECLRGEKERAVKSLALK